MNPMLLSELSKFRKWLTYGYYRDFIFDTYFTTMASMYLCLDSLFYHIHLSTVIFTMKTFPDHIALWGFCAFQALCYFYVNYTPRQTKFVGGDTGIDLSVCPSVCRRDLVRSITGAMLLRFISYVVPVFIRTK